MLLSCSISCLAMLLLVIYGQESLLMLKIASGLLGFGMASIYATGLLWMEQYIKITNRIGASMTIASSIGADVFPLITGQLVVDIPMILMYLTFATIAVCTVNFMLALIVGRYISNNKIGAADVEETAL